MKARASNLSFPNRVGILRCLAISTLLVAVCSSSEKINTETTFSVALAPSSIALNSPASGISEIGQKLTLEIKNTTQKAQVYNVFYGGWTPVITTKSGKQLAMNYTRDGTRRPNPSDFPKLAPNAAGHAEVGIRLNLDAKGYQIVIDDTRGGVFSARIEAGQYKLHILYSSVFDDWISEVADGKFGFTFSGLVIGKEKSNVIKLSIGEQPEKVASRLKPSEQDGADQPATAPEAKPEGNNKPKPESEVRPQ